MGLLMAPTRPSCFGEAFAGLLVAAQANAPWAFDRLYQALAPKVVGYLRLQGASEPEDLASEVFLGAFSRIGTFSGTEEQFRSWLFTIAHRRWVDDRRRQARRPRPAPEAELQDAPAPGGTEQAALSRLSEERVRVLCGRLVPDQRDVLLLRLVGGLTVPEVADALGKSPGAVAALQRRGIVALRKVLEREGVLR